ncbi:hypothetical protein Ddc_18394 [Ditylenchus destructor]|nr:hypothetical protein Ddc_18394 [Ditylenchus destructor]
MGFSGLPEAINPETWKSSSARPVPIASSHREEAIGISHARIRAPIRKSTKMVISSRKKVEIPEKAWLDTLQFLTRSRWQKMSFVSRQLAKMVQGNISELPPIKIDNVKFIKTYMPLKPAMIVASNVAIPPNEKREWFMKRGINPDAPTGLQHQDAIIGMGAKNQPRSSFYYYANGNVLAETSKTTHSTQKTVWQKRGDKPKSVTFFAEFNPNYNQYSWASMEYFLNLLYNPRTYIEEVEMYALNKNLTDAFFLGEDYGSHIHCGKFIVMGDFCKSLPWIQRNVRADIIYFPGKFIDDGNSYEEKSNFFLAMLWKCSKQTQIVKTVQIKLEWVCRWKLFIRSLIKKFRALSAIERDIPTIEFSFLKYSDESLNLDYLKSTSSVFRAFGIDIWKNIKRSLMNSDIVVFDENISENEKKQFFTDLGMSFNAPAYILHKYAVIGLSSKNWNSYDYRVEMCLRGMQQSKNPVILFFEFKKHNEYSWAALQYFLEFLYYPALYIKEVEMFALNQKMINTFFEDEERFIFCGSFTWKRETETLNMDEFHKSLCWIERNVRANTIHIPAHIDYKKESCYGPIASFLLDASWKCAREQIHFKCICNLGSFIQALVEKFRSVSFVRKDIPTFTVTGNDEVMSVLLSDPFVLKLKSDYSQGAAEYLIFNGDNRMHIEAVKELKNGFHGCQENGCSYLYGYSKYHDRGSHLFRICVKVYTV